MKNFELDEIEKIISKIPGVGKLIAGGIDKLQGQVNNMIQTAKEEAPVIGGIKMKKLGKGPKGSYKSLVTRHLGAKAAEKIDKSDGSKLVAKGKKTGNKELVRKGNFIKNIIGRK